MTSAFYALGLYAGLLGLIALWLFANVGKVKHKNGITMGDGGNARVIRAMRGQMNFVENVPMILILLVIGASLNMPAIAIHVIAIHVIGIALVLGRLCHALHFTKDDAPAWQRAAGAMLTFAALAGASLALIGHALISMF